MFYSIPQLPPGTYRIVLQKHGFRTIIKPGVELRVQDIIALNFEMQVGSVAESITVEEGAPLLQAETATLGQIIDRNVMAELPTLTRNPYDFVALSAGARLRVYEGSGFRTIVSPGGTGMAQDPVSGDIFIARYFTGQVVRVPVQ